MPLRLSNAQGGHVDDVVDLHPSLEHVHRGADAGEDGPDGFHLAESPEQLVGDVRGLQIRADQVPAKNTG